jgi:hypothetical protein
MNNKEDLLAAEASFMNALEMLTSSPPNPKPAPATKKKAPAGKKATSDSISALPNPPQIQPNTLASKPSTIMPSNLASTPPMMSFIDADFFNNPLQSNSPPHALSNSNSSVIDSPPDILGALSALDWHVSLTQQDRLQVIMLLYPSS